jgi:hypothetical protein
MRSVFLVTTVSVMAFFLAYPQSAPDARTLSIAGRSEYAKILELSGRSYVEVTDVARLIRGSLTFKANQVLLTLPAEPAQSTGTVPPRTQGFSKEFLQAGIEQMSAIREWRITVVNAIHENSPVSAAWISELQRRAQKNLALTTAATSTEDDRNGHRLLAAEFANMQKLSDRFLAMRKQLQYIRPDSINNDPLDQQILACAQSLASMAAANQFHDEPSCIEAR